MSQNEKQQLDQEGYVILRDFITPERLEVLRHSIEALYAEQGERAGSEYRQEPQTRRLANLVNCGELFEQVVAEPKVLSFVQQVLGDEFKLSSLNFRSANPYSNWVQPLHCDVGAVPDDKGFWVCNVIWLLDDFTADNGTTRFVPGTHRTGKLPQEVLSDPAAPHPDEKIVLETAGTVVVMNAHMWHGATANRTAHHRRALHSFYCRADKPQQQYQKQLLSPEVQERLSPALRKLLALDDPLNDELSSKLSGASGFLK
ncbi:MAG: phytanoyl-CoA dioxygenase family protein [Acidobacteria bacterium]|nr:phytanoyl-CoA dioxygenase family protein [Acidobacteriota bacterium]